MTDLGMTPRQYRRYLYGPVNGVGRHTYDAYLGGARHAELRGRIVHIGEGRVAGNPFALRYGSLYLGDRLTVATGCRTDTGGWGPEVRSALTAREAVLARDARHDGQENCLHLPSSRQCQG